MSSRPFDVVVVPFPFTDKQAVKRRPAVVVSSTAFNSRHDHVILAMVTSAKQSHWPSDVHLRNWQAAGLSVPCRVRFKLFTLDQALVVRRIGSLTDEDSSSVKKRLAENIVA